MTIWTVNDLEFVGWALAHDLMNLITNESEGLVFYEHICSR
jgi:hypothetical protein